MQKILAKYGLAAHLAILAVAPLFLFPFLRDDAMATVMIWLSALASLWIVASPSVRRDEMPHDARERAFRHIVRDPLLWIMLVLIALAGLRSLNSGVARAYDSELSQWLVSSAKFEWFPGSVGKAGCLPFATAVSFMVVTLGIRHALGSSARMAFLFLVSTFSGLAGAMSLFAAHEGCSAAIRAMAFGVATDHIIGTAFAVCMLGGVVALVATLEHKWNHIVPLLVLGIGGNIAGCFAFSSPIVVLAFLLPLAVITAYAFWYLHGTLDANGEYKLLALVAISLAVGGLLGFVMMSPEIVDARVGAIIGGKPIPADYSAARSALVAAAMRAWRTHAWLGLGCGSTQLALEFFVTQGDWRLLPPGIASVPNGWCRMLMESGVSGLAAQLLPIGVLCYAFVIRIAAGVRNWQRMHPACWLFPVTAVSLVAVGFFDVSPFRAEVSVLFGAVCALAVNSVVTDRR